VDFRTPRKKIRKCLLTLCRHVPSANNRQEQKKQKQAKKKDQKENSEDRAQTKKKMNAG